MTAVSTGFQAGFVGYYDHGRREFEMVAWQGWAATEIGYKDGEWHIMGFGIGSFGSSGPAPAPAPEPVPAPVPLETIGLPPGFLDIGPQALYSSETINIGGGEIDNSSYFSTPAGWAVKMPKLRKTRLEKALWVNHGDTEALGWTWAVDYIEPPHAALTLGYPNVKVHWRNAFVYQERGHYRWAPGTEVTREFQVYGKKTTTTIVNSCAYSYNPYRGKSAILSQNRERSLLEVLS